MIRRMLFALFALALPLGLTLVVTPPAHAIEWSPKTCREYSNSGFKVCERYYTTVWGNTYAVHYAEVCLTGMGTAAPLVKYATNNRVKITTSNGVFLGQEYFGDVDKGDCRLVTVSPAVEGNSGMEGTWTGKVITDPGWDDNFDICRKVLNGLACIF